MGGVNDISPTFLTALFCLAALVGHVINRWRSHRAFPIGTSLMFVLGIWGLTESYFGVVWLTIGYTIWRLAWPAICLNRSMIAANSGRFNSAYIWAKLAAPAEKNAKIWSQTWRVISELYTGKSEAAEDLSVSLISNDDPAADIARQVVLIHLRYWSKLLSAPLSDVRARALCELGQINEAILETARLWSPRMSIRRQIRARNAMIPTFAFCGSIQTVKCLCDLTHMPHSQKAMWVAVSESAAGHHQRAQNRLNRIQDSNPAIRSAIEYRKHHMPGRPMIDASNRAFLESIESEVAVAYHLRREPITRHWGVTVIVAALLFGYATQWYCGDTESGDIAWQLGALIPEGQLPKETWRLVAYAGLHFGWLHLATNVFVCIVLGSIIARWLGSLGFVSFFVIGVVMAGINISLVGTYGVTVGASGGTMALFGLLVGHIWSRPPIRTTRWGRSIGYALTALVVLEIVIDVFVPQVSGAGHAGGLIFGVLAGVTRLSGDMGSIQRDEKGSLDS